MEDILKSDFETADLFKVDNREFSIERNTIVFNDEDDGNLVYCRLYDSIENKKYVFSKEWLDKNNVEYFRFPTTKDKIKRYLELCDKAETEEEKAEEIEMNVLLCYDLGIDAGDRTSTCFEDITLSNLEIEDETYISYEDDEFIIVDGQEYGYDSYLIGSMKKIKDKRGS